MEAIGKSATHDYLWSGADVDEEAERRLMMAKRHDQKTRRLCLDLGLGAGWSCLEIGAGAGTVACFFSDVVGPAGRVVATDLDLRHCEAAGRGNVELRVHDITTDSLEGELFDMIHARSVLLHLRDPSAAAEKLFEALKPGGWLFLEEVDNATSITVSPSHPIAPVFDDTTRRIKLFLTEAGIFDAYFGRKLPALFERLGLVDIDNEVSTRVVAGGEPAARLMAMTEAGFRDFVVAGGAATQDEMEARQLAYHDTDFRFMESLIVSTWGRRPA